MSPEFESSAARLRHSALQHGLAGQAAQEGPVVPRAKAFLLEAREIQLAAHRAGLPGDEVAKLRSDAIDIVIDALYLRAGPAAASLTLVATGGYGRAELCPLSDIDLLVLVPAHTAETKQAVETILYPLWDVGLKVGQSVRTVAEAADYARNDLHLHVALLETRLLCGERSQFAQLEVRLSELLSGEAWLPLAKAIVESQRKRREKAGGSAYLQEPDLKNGVGALRDVQGCVWLARIARGVAGPSGLGATGFLATSDLAKFEQARASLLRLRCELHFQVTRPTEQLSLERQDTIAEGLGYPGDLKSRIGALMRDYFDAADHVRRCAEMVEGAVMGEPEPTGWGEPILVDGFRLVPGGTVAAQHRLVFEEDPGRLVRLFRLCQVHEARPERALSLLVRERAHLLTADVAYAEESCSALRAMLTEAGRVFGALHALREHDLLYRLVPEFAGLHCLVQFEFYHRWTADVHTLRCLMELDEIYEGKTEVDRRYREVVLGSEAPSFLYAILFLHDIAKAGGIAGHAERGVPIAEVVLERLGFDAREREVAAAVIRHHLIMGIYWQRHDVDDPANIERFASIVGDEQVLRSLYVHTRCDARATSPDLWTSFKDGQHGTLYRRTLAKLAGESEAEAEVAATALREQTAELLAGTVPADELEAHFTQMPSGYFLHVAPEDAAVHVALIHRLIATVAHEDAEQSLQPIVEWHDDVGSGQSVVTVVTWDRAGLFSRMAGAFAVAGINIVSCRAFSREDDVAIDFFKVVLPVGKELGAKQKFAVALASSLVGGYDLIDEVGQEEVQATLTAPRRKAFVPLAAEVSVYYEEALGRTVAEVQCNDRLGLLFRIGLVIRGAGYAITFANISTEQGFALDTFYLTPERGLTTTPQSPEALADGLRQVVS
jgi:[protein-PII] uridylyltransferase